MTDRLAAPPRRPSRAPLLALALLAVPAFAAVALRAWVSSFHFILNINEGFNASQAAEWARAGRLYYGASELITNNYPPLFFIITSYFAFGHADLIRVGRIVAWVAFFLSGGAIGLIIHRLHRDLLAAIAGGLVFCGAIAMLFPLHLGSNEPQMCAHCLVLLGIWVGLGGSGARTQLAAAALMVAGLFFKHNGIALPGAYGLWLLATDRRAGLCFAAAAIGLGGAGLAACLLAFGPDFAANLLGARPWDALTGLRHLLTWVASLDALLVLAAVALAAAPARRESLLFAGAVALALALGCVQLFSRGIYYNALYELVIALALAIGHGIALAPAPRMRAVLVAAATPAIFLVPDVTQLQDLLRPRAFVARMHEREQATGAIVAALRDAPGPAFCETLAYCYWAGKAFEVEPFNLSQRLLAGTGSDASLVRRIEAGAFAAIAMDGTPPPDGASLFSADVWRAVRGRYQALSTISGRTTVFVRPQ